MPDIRWLLGLTTDRRQARVPDPAGLTTPVIGYPDGAPGWIEGDDLAGVTVSLLGEGRPTAAYVLPGNRINTMPAAATLATGARYYQPLIVYETLTLVALVAEVTGGNAATRALRGGLYAADETWQPGALIGEGAFDASTTGVKTIAIAATLTPGRYVTAMESNHATPTWRVWTTDPWWATTGANGMIRHLQVSGTSYGTLPDPGAAWDAFLTGTTFTNHRVLLQVNLV